MGGEINEWLGGESKSCLKDDLQHSKTCDHELKLTFCVFDTNSTKTTKLFVSGGFSKPKQIVITFCMCI